MGILRWPINAHQPKHRAVFPVGNHLRWRRKIHICPAKPARRCRAAERPGSRTFAAGFGRNRWGILGDASHDRDADTQPFRSRGHHRHFIDAPGECVGDSACRSASRKSIRRRCRRRRADESASSITGGRQPAAQQHAAVSFLELLHRLAGYISIAWLARVIQGRQRCRSKTESQCP